MRSPLRSAWTRPCADLRADPVLTAFGATAVTFMMGMYALERRHPRYILAFAFGCMLSSVYGFLAGTWPFGVVEAIWATIALRRYQTITRQRRPTPTK